MDAKKRGELEAIFMHGKVTLLDNALVENGVVWKKTIDTSETLEVALLCLSPGAVIKEHMHNDDIEFYAFFDGKMPEYCPKGSHHHLENSTNEKMYVFSLKIKYT